MSSKSDFSKCQWLVGALFLAYIGYSSIVDAASDEALTEVPRQEVRQTQTLADQLLIADYGEGGDLVLQLYLRDILLTDALFAQVSNGRVYLPLGELAALLDLAILVDPAAGRASGWFYNPDNRFELDVASGKVSTSGLTSELRGQSLLEDDYDLFVDTDTLSDWFSFQFDFSLSSQLLIIRSAKPLPAELSRIRAKKTVLEESVFSATGKYNIPGYRLVDWPSVSVNLGSFVNSQSTSITHDYSATASGDLAFMNGSLSASGDSDEIKSLRLTLGRRNPSGMLGPLGVADYEFGDTAQYLPGLIGSSLSGRGVRFGNRNLTAQRDFDKIDLKGDLQPDFEVELYVNNRLAGVERDASNGLYDFADVPLRLGQNELRLEFYGPQGQRFSETRRYFFGSGQNRPGQFKYEFAMVQPGRLVFEDINDAVRKRAEDIPSNQLSTAMEVSYGISSRATLGVTVAHLASNEGQLADEEESVDDAEPGALDRYKNNLTYINTRLSASMLGYHLTYDLSMDDDLDVAGGLSLRTRKGSYEYGLEQIIYGVDYRRYNDLDVENPSQLPKAVTTARVSRNFSLSQSRAAISWGGGVTYTVKQNDAKTVALNGQLDVYGKYLNGSWSHSYSRNLASEEDGASGRVGLYYRPGDRSGWSYRADLDYLDPAESLITAGTVGAYRRLNNNGSLSFQASRSADDREISLSSSWQRQFKHYRFSSTLTSRGSDDISLRLGLVLAAGRKPGSYLPMISGLSALNSPRVGVLVFVDDNNNKIHDNDEEVIKGVPITRNGLSTSAITDDKGYAVVVGLSDRVSVDIGIISTGLRNPELRATQNRFGVLPRRGRLPIIQIPLVRTRDIEGTVSIATSSPAPNVNIMLKPLSGGDPLSVKTEYDGVYYLAGVPLGSYELTPDRDQLQSIGLYAEPEAIQLHISRQTGITVVENINLVRGGQVSGSARSEELTRVTGHLLPKEQPNKQPGEQPVKPPAVFPVHVQAEPALQAAIPGTPAGPVLDSAHFGEAEIVSVLSPKVMSDRSVIPGGDADGDGVLNEDDRCQNSRRSDRVNGYGCVYAGGQLYGVEFAPGSVSVSSDMAFALNALGRELRDNPSLKIQIEAHTDNRGKARHNMRLSMKRARSILEYLSTGVNVPPSQLSGVGMGESRPVASNRSREGRKKNRRVVVNIAGAK